MENFLKDVSSKSPYLVHAQADKTADSTTQIFVILEQDVLCECSRQANHSIFTSSLVTLMSVYYAFN